MALAINPNFEVVKEIPCVWHIQVLLTVLSDVTQAVAGKTIAESTMIKKLHTDGTSHKSTEIVNIVCIILNKDNKLKTISLATDQFWRTYLRWPRFHRRQYRPLG